MTIFLFLVVIGVVVGVTTVLFGFGGGFVTVPVITVVNLSMGGDGVRVATATSALVMLVNALAATAVTPRAVLGHLRGRWTLFILLGLGGALGAASARFAPEALLKWGFVVYVAVTVIDLVARPGFIRTYAAGSVPAKATTSAAISTHGVSNWGGLPIGTIAAFLGVGGSVMTVPMMRRGGATMNIAAALANPLTLAIVIPALAVSLVVTGQLASTDGLVGSVDVVSGLALLIGSMPAVILLRRRPPRIKDSVHAWVYVLLLITAAVAVAVFG